MSPEAFVYGDSIGVGEGVRLRGHRDDGHQLTEHGVGHAGAAREVKEQGTFGYLDRSLATPDLNAFMES